MLLASLNVGALLRHTPKHSIRVDQYRFLTVGTRQPSDCIPRKPQAVRVMWDNCQGMYWGNSRHAAVERNLSSNKAIVHTVKARSCVNNRTFAVPSQASDVASGVKGRRPSPVSPSVTARLQRDPTGSNKGRTRVPLGHRSPAA